jgi:hypothetical protein
MGEIPHPPPRDRMTRFHGQIEQAVYAAEQLCPNKTDDEKANCKDTACSFCKPDRCVLACDLIFLRGALGQPVKQDDIPQCPVKQDPPRLIIKPGGKEPGTGPGMRTP